MNLVVTPATAADITAMVEILSDGVSFKQAHKDDSWGSGLYTNEEIQSLLKTGSAYLARLDDKPVGTLLLQWQDDLVWDTDGDNAGYIHQFAIKSGFHGQGLGSQIIDWAAAESARHGKKFLRLDCHSDNKKLCAYYESQGFVLVGLKSIPAFNNYTASLYERALK